jgi:hypothetical protein
VINPSVLGGGAGMMAASLPNSKNGSYGIDYGNKVYSNFVE